METKGRTAPDFAVLSAEGFQLLGQPRRATDEDSDLAARILFADSCQAYRPIWAPKEARSGLICSGKRIKAACFVTEGICNLQHGSLASGTCRSLNISIDL